VDIHAGSFSVSAPRSPARSPSTGCQAPAANTPPGFWVNGFLFDDTKLDRPLTRKDLDEATTAHPVSVAHRGAHTTFYNSKAFELAGITNQTPDPPDGRFFRDGGN
jgi:predicted amidohydrolase YtcJ